MTFDDDRDDNAIYYGQGGLIRGNKIAQTPVRWQQSAGGNTNSRKRRRVSFSEFASYEAMPVTAKHNLELAEDDRAYLRTSVKFVDGPDKDVSMPDGGCAMTDEIEAPGTFSLRVGHKIGMAVYRTFNITHEDACAPMSVRLTDIYGPKHQVCIYTGEVIEVSEQSATFCHSINAFEGSSGAVVFLFDQGQDAPQEVADGMAFGIHVGGLDRNNNIGFMLR